MLLPPVLAMDATPTWMCRFYQARDGEGRAAGRIPLRLSATLRMMSTARRSDATGAREDLATGLPSLGAGRFEEPQASSSGGGDSGNVGNDGNDGGASEGNAGSGGPALSRAPVSSSGILGNGFLAIGSDRSFPHPAVHPALCPG